MVNLQTDSLKNQDFILVWLALDSSKCFRSKCSSLLNNSLGKTANVRKKKSVYTPENCGTEWQHGLLGASLKGWVGKDGRGERRRAGKRGQAGERRGRRGEGRQRRGGLDLTSQCSLFVHKLCSHCHLQVHTRGEMLNAETEIPSPSVPLPLTSHLARGQWSRFSALVFHLLPYSCCYTSALNCPRAAGDEKHQ